MVFDQATRLAFSDKLADSDYDLIFVDFENGSGDIRHNAMIVANVVEWVSAHYASDVPFHFDPATNQQIPDTEHQISIIGQSMGGLIGRFALGYLDHGSSVVAALGGSAPAHPGATAFVKVLVTRDSPHRGANTPLGLQSAVRRLARMEVVRLAMVSPLFIPFSTLHLENIVPKLHNAYALLSEPASEQLILYSEVYTPSLTNAYALGQTAGNLFRDYQYNWMVVYPPGITPHYQTAALSNGSECATPQPLPPYGEIARLEAHYYINPILIAPILAGGAIAQVAANDFGQGLYLRAISIVLSTLTGRDFDSEIIVNALPDPSAGSKRIFHARFTVMVRLFPSFNFWVFKKIRIPIRIFDANTDSPAGLPTYDSAPGGYYKNDLVFDVPGLANTHGLTSFFIDTKTHIAFAPSFCFVPPASGIDYPATRGWVNFNNQKVLSTPALTQVYTDNQPAGTQSRLQRFVTQEPSVSLPSNTRHIQFTTRSAQYVYSLLSTGTATSSCLTLCGITGIALEGPANVCQAGTVYQCVPAIAGAVYKWKVTANLGIEDPLTPGTLLTPAPDGSYPSLTGFSSIKVRSIAPGGSVTNTITLEVVAEPCRSFEVITKEVSALEAPQQPSGVDVLSDEDPCLPQFTITSLPAAGASHYSWTLTRTGGHAGLVQPTSPLSGTSVTPPAWNFLPIDWGRAVNITIHLTAYSNCGSATSSGTFTEIIARPVRGGGMCRPAGPSSPFALFPIPANATMHVELVDTDSVATWDDSPALSTHLEVVDLYGQSWLTQTAPGRTADLPLLAVPTGFYILRAQRGSRLETTQISVQH